MKRIITKAVTLAALAAFTLVATPALALASEEAGEESAVGVGLLIPKMGEFIPMLLGFIILWAVLAKLAWPAFIGMIDKRTATIKDSLEHAENAKLESERVLEEQKAELALAKKQAAEIIAQARQTAESVKADIAAQAKSEAEVIIAKAQQAIDTEKKAAIAELQGSAADLTVSVAKKVIGTDLSDAEHRTIIQRYIAEAGSFNEN
ncbi:MAG: F0F1 ATP synthase subunit B [Coriobacteriales bacterium]|jgi:F-type H+-transporting ATPase subunit b|nr:F0F1 ATP synthase subunit B [Coriobacteriales bacterium]